MIELEICCADIESILIASEAGAKRVELCADIISGGITPSAGATAMAVELGIPSVNVLIRPRGGDFFFSSFEKKCMEADIRRCAESGATGVVLGAMTRSGQLDAEWLGVAVNLAQTLGLEAVLSRAFDLCDSQFSAMDQAMEIGFDRILTSGGKESAPEGCDVLRRLVDIAGNSITIMAGGGIRPENVRRLIETTGVKAVHSTASASTLQTIIPPERKHLEVPAGFGVYSSARTSAQTVKQLIKNIQ